MACVKIFLENRIILLTDAQPGKESTEGVVVDRYKGGQIRKLFSAFEKDESCRKLIIYKERDTDGLMMEFMRMFEYVEAAGGKVLNEKGHLLTIFRYGRWDLPKGKITKSGSQPEKPVEGALREVREETGLVKVSAGKELPSTYHIFTHHNKKILKRTYWFEMSAPGDQLLVPQREEDISVVRWVAPDEIDEIRKNTYASLMDLLHL